MRGNNTSRPAVPARSAPRQGQRDTHSRQRHHLTPRQAAPLILRGTLPPQSVVTGNLTFQDNREPIFAPGTHIRGNLRLLGCGKGTKLAGGMTIDGIADFSMTPLTALPERFTVGMCLDVSDTHIQEFPRNLKVGWKIQVGKNATQSMKARVAALDRKTCQPAKASGRKATA